MEGTKVIKVVLPGLCPHCGKEVLISNRMLTPVIDWVLKREDIENAKNKVKEEVKVATFQDEGERKMIIDWLEHKDTLFGPSEVETVLRQVLKIGEEKVEEKPVEKKKTKK